MRPLTKRGSQRTLSIALAGLGLWLAPSRALAAATIAIVDPVSPPAVSSVPDVFSVKADVRDPFAIISVVAEVGGTSVLMTRSAGYWAATLDIGALPLGPVTMTVTVVDANGDTTTASKALLHDHPPTLAVATPTEVVATPTVSLRATCSKADAYVCASIQASIGTKVLASGTTALSQTVSLAAWEGKAVAVRFDAVDTAGLVTTTTIQTYVETSPNLLKIDEVDGPILDADPTRILYAGPSGVWTVKDRATGALTAATGARLPASGATDDSKGTGDWSVSVTRTAAIRRNLVTGAEDVIDAAKVTGTPFPTRLQVVDAGVDAAGNVFVATFADGAFWVRSNDLTRGTRICNEARLPLVDGGHVVYMRMLRTPGLREIYLGTAGAGAEVLLDSSYDQRSTRVTTPRVDYRAFGGWVAYTNSVGPGPELEVWTRSPTGEQRRASPYTDANLALAGLNASGEVVVDHPGGRAISVTGKPALSIGGASGSMRYFDGVWHELKGRVLFRVAPGAGGPGADAGADGGGHGSAAEDASAAGPSAPDPSAVDRGGAAPATAGRAGNDEAPSTYASCAMGGVASGGSLGVFVIALAAAAASRRRRRTERPSS